MSNDGEDTTVKNDNTFRKRRHSEGSVLDSATSTVVEMAQSKSRFGSEGNISLESSHLSNKQQPSELLITEQDFHRRPMKCTRNDSLRTQASIQLLDEKLSMIGYLKSHLSHCRDLENALNDLRKQLHGIASFRKELIDLKSRKSSENCDLYMDSLSNKDGRNDELL